MYKDEGCHQVSGLGPGVHKLVMGLGRGQILEYIPFLFILVAGRF